MSVCRSLLILSLSLFAPLSFSQAEDDFFDFEEEVNCENLEESFKEYIDIINLYRSAFSRSLKKMEVLAEKMRSQDLTSAELQNLTQELSEARSVSVANELVLSEKEWRIQEALSRCMK